MGEWSDYFEDFPEENPANYVGNRFDPQTAQALRAHEAKTVSEQAKLNAEIASIIKKSTVSQQVRPRVPSRPNRAAQQGAPADVFASASLRQIRG